jgi:hypothetical protein
MGMLTISQPFLRRKEKALMEKERTGDPLWDHKRKK